MSGFAVVIPSAITDEEKVTKMTEWLCRNGDEEPQLSDSQQATALISAIHTNCGFVRNDTKSVKRKFVFLKTHKTASTTLQTMVARTASRYQLVDLRCVMPHEERLPHFISELVCDKDTKFPLPRGADFVMSHVLDKTYWWNVRPDNPSSCDYFGGFWFDHYVDKVHAAIQDNDAPIIIPLREQYNHLQSVLKYYGVNVSKYIQNEDLWNPASLDIRLLSDKDVTTFLEKYVNSAYSRLIIPLLTETLDESLVAMRRTMNWNLSDVIYMSTFHTGAPPKPVQEDFKERTKKTLRLDKKLYKGFEKLNTKLQKRVNTPDFYLEVLSLKRINSLAAKVCNCHEKTRSMDIESLVWWCNHLCITEIELDDVTNCLE